MIESLRLVAAPCFPLEGIDVGPFKAINYIFGPNGSGKTTISRAFHDPSAFPGSSLHWKAPASPLSAKVYNRDYVDRTFSANTELPGVFILGEDNKDVQDEIENLSGKDGTIAQLRRHLDADRTILGSTDGQGSGKLGEIQSQRDRLADAAWTSKASIPTDLEPMFVGFKNSKVKLAERVLEVAGVVPAGTRTLTDLQLAAQSAFDQAASEQDLLKLQDEPNLVGVEGAELLAVRILGSDDVAIAPLIEALQNSDWIMQGRKYFDAEHGVCPFCQQSTGDQFAHDLNDYFDDRYSEQSARLAKFAERHEVEMQRTTKALETIEESSSVFLDATKFKAASAALESMIKQNQTALAGKLDSPSSMVELESLSELYQSVKSVTDLANSRILQHNSRVRNRARSRAELIVDCWNYFVHGLLAAEVATFQAHHVDLNRAVENLKMRIADNLQRLGTAQNRLRDLEKQVTSSKPVIDEINAMLASVGFASFSLADARELRGGYYLTRPDGSHVTNSLSEGERTFITFLYFFHQLRGLTSAPDEPRERVAIIDDPISSLDSDVLFVVTSLIRRLATEIQTGAGFVKQLIVLTHNVHFHKEVTYQRHGEPQSNRSFHVIRKRSPQPSAIARHEKNPIKTSYARLWEEIGRARDESETSGVGLQNVMRRILENYFRILGSFSDEEIIRNFIGSEQVICRALFSWVNDGSHVIIDEIDYSPSEVTADMYLGVFREIFVRTGHTAHYDMMLPAPQVVV